MRKWIASIRRNDRREGVPCVFRIKPIGHYFVLTHFAAKKDLCFSIQHPWLPSLSSIHFLGPSSRPARRRTATTTTTKMPMNVARNIRVPASAPRTQPAQWSRNKSTISSSIFDAKARVRDARRSSSQATTTTTAPNAYVLSSLKFSRLLRIVP